MRGHMLIGDENFNPDDTRRTNWIPALDFIPGTLWVSEAATLSPPV